MNYTKIATNKIIDIDENTSEFKILRDYPENWERLNHTKLLSMVLQNLKPNANTSAYTNFLIYAYYNWLPDYFFTTPASSTGKYHPAFANMSNGLVLHSCAVVEFVKILFDMNNAGFDDETYNMLVVAAFLHDMFKYGDPNTYTPNTYTVFEHSEIAYEFLMTNEVREIATRFGISDDKLVDMANVIRCHMGKWNTSKRSNVVLKTPVTILDNMLHTADFLASRKENEIVAEYIKASGHKA